ncbi:S-adenosylmethionine:tRNA ribosyltransferase-isomerase [Flavisolibacter ginsengisoli]|jgi:S-adenosylmethionine:tRNA ribosyltransferase-isomerase|uniref:S-adenosylmethionine:tRNA ribosyltransferase-isomerase n=1 Tax=Flavisolibacter ginsengisoli DSM 18119 TaxID=1121884 RepID=A0A1M5CS94_9BACT|nr:S-adenosylmethionine:tRNA ribosyltransferase-isomerase [Flavisolibacter ginsengisoli]SHF57566.1 S-adenosylmethionine:tRNA ribosyltransferase-isomerase [Flavisolibacter ginsengisoli DSM 18119]
MKISPETVYISDYNYELPSANIAEVPLLNRDDSKLLIYEKGKIIDSVFHQLPSYIEPGSTLILNNTRVIEARLLFQKDTGATIELFCLEPYELSIEQAMQQHEKIIWKCLIGGASKWKPGQLLTKPIGENSGYILTARYIEKREDYFLIEFSWNNAAASFVEVLHETGAIPLPPYIKRKAEKLDWERYQTVFSEQEGSVAAPTAALHFTQNTFQQLKERNVAYDYITLHVGAGTFKPVKSATIAGHSMHAEPFSVKKQVIEELIKAAKIIATGTTSLRTLESLYWISLKLKLSPNAELMLDQWEAYAIDEQLPNIPAKESFEYLLQWMNEHAVTELHCRTSLIIIPGYQFKVAHGLITNFHQPHSTLLLLIAAFIGDNWKKVYSHALQNNYRFLSYGDSSLLWR